MPKICDDCTYCYTQRPYDIYYTVSVIPPCWAIAIDVVWDFKTLVVVGAHHLNLFFMGLILYSFSTIFCCQESSVCVSLSSHHRENHNCKYTPQISTNDPQSLWKQYEKMSLKNHRGHILIIFSKNVFRCIVIQLTWVHSKLIICAVRTEDNLALHLQRLKDWHSFCCHVYNLRTDRISVIIFTLPK